MIPASFAYHRPRSLDEAIELLARHGEDARVVAGGHSLIPMMKLRLARPEYLVDLQDLAELRGIRSEPDAVIIGAMTTQHELIGSELLAGRLPIIRETALQIADPQVRYCGTLGGNVANGDPGNDMPAVMMALDARYRLKRDGGERQVAARDFYDGVYSTALQPGEILVRRVISGSLTLVRWRWRLIDVDASGSDPAGTGRGVVPCYVGDGHPLLSNRSIDLRRRVKCHLGWGGGRARASRWEAAANQRLGAIARCSRTGSSNPSPSSRESVSLRISPSFLVRQAVALHEPPVMLRVWGRVERVPDDDASCLALWERCANPR